MELSNCCKEPVIYEQVEPEELYTNIKVNLCSACGLSCDIYEPIKEELNEKRNNG